MEGHSCRALSATRGGSAHGCRFSTSRASAVVREPKIRRCAVQAPLGVDAARLC